MPCAGTFVASQHRDYSALIAALPIMVLLALCALAGTVMLGGACQGAAHVPLAAGRAGALASQAPKQPVHLLRCGSPSGWHGREGRCSCESPRALHGLARSMSCC